MFILFAKYYIVFSVKPAFMRGVDKLNYFLNKFLRKKKTIISESKSFDLLRTTNYTPIKKLNVEFNGELKNILIQTTAEQLDPESV